MKLYDLVEATNSIVNKNYGTLVLYRTVSPNPIVKINKKYSYNLYLVKDKNNKELVLSKNYSFNISLDELDNYWDEADFMFMKDFIYWLTSEGVNKLK